MKPDITKVIKDTITVEVFTYVQKTQINFRSLIRKIVFTFTVTNGKPSSCNKYIYDIIEDKDCLVDIKDILFQDEVQGTYDYLTCNLS